MEQEAVYFVEIGIIISAFHENKRLINITEVDIEKIKLLDKKSFGKDSFRYFIGYRHEGNTFPSLLCVKLPQMNACTKYFDKNNKYINLRKTFCEIWNNIKSLSKIEFNSELVYHHE